MINSVHKRFFFLILCLLSFGTYAGGGGLTGGATEITQIANNAELGAVLSQETRQVSNQLIQIQNQIQQYQQLVNQYNNMVQNTLNLPNHIWGNATQHLQQLANIVQTGEALAYSGTNLDSQFQAKFRSYDDHLVRDYNRANFKSEYRSWSETNRDSIRSALRAAGLQSEQFADENSTLRQIELLSQSSTGRLQAIQAGSLIAAQQVRQTQKLRQLIMSQIQLSVAAETSIQAEKDRDQAVRESYFTNSLKDLDVNDGQGF